MVQGNDMGKKFVCLLIIFLSMSLCLNIVSFTRAADQVNIVPDNYPTITEALLNSQDGDTIFVKNGTYRESQLNVTKSIKLIGEDANNTKIINTDQVNWDPTLYPFPQPFPKIIYITADNVQVTGFTLSCNYSRWAPIDINANNVIANCNIFGETGSTVVNGNNNAVIQNLFTKDVAGPFIGCSGSNNTIASNVMIRESEIANAYLNVRGVSNLVYNNTLKNGIIELSGYKHMIINNKFVNGGLVINQDSFDCTISNQKINSISLMGFNHVFCENEIGTIEIGGVHGSEDAANNSFYRNNFLGEPPELGVGTKAPGPIIWDNGVEGNYWVGYRGSDANNDGIGDTPYIIDSNNQDNYPIMLPVDVAIELPTPSYSTSPSPTPSSSVPELSWLAVIALIVGMLFIAVILRHRKTTSQKTMTSISQ